ncbi:MAG: hypothetical protein P4L33_09335 [Capsulimonadaceae bacterium]|nr:hypothetical protein [Capsulimonadaceae bacterium]
MARFIARRRIPALIVTLFVLSLCGASMPLRVAHASGQLAAARPAASPAPPAAHGEDHDLVYQWEDIKYSREELLQMRGAASFLLVAAIFGLVRGFRLKELTR